jgi:F-type H+-transporting ATPase subunit a
MITNLFSSFDPSTRRTLSLNWVSGIILALIVNVFWVKKRASKQLIRLLTEGLYKEFKIIVFKNKYFRFVLISLFIFIIINNFIGLFPYIFTSTSHIVISLTMAVPLWLGIILFGWIKFNKDMFAHLVPQRTPGVLIPFMVLIESVRNIIRPMTLAIRLSANIIAGHLLMTLLGNQLAQAAPSALPLVILVQLALVSLEIAVSMIQAYVFCVLITLYIGEIGSH